MTDTVCLLAPWLSYGPVIKGFSGSVKAETECTVKHMGTFKVPSNIPAGVFTEQ